MSDSGELKIAKAAVRSVKLQEYITNANVMQWTDNDWLSLLCAAPVCLEMLGSCSLAASTEVARRTKITLKQGSRSKKQYEYLNTNLTEVTHIGQKAFQTASKNMYLIQTSSGNAKKHIVRIFRFLSTTPFNAPFTRSEMDAVSKIADTCETAAREMEDEFTIWQQYIMDLYEAVVEQQGHTETQFATASNEAAAKKVLQESHEQTLAEHKTKVATIEGRVTELYDSYKDIQSKFPTGDDLLKAQLTLMGAEMLGTLVKSLGNAVAAKINPMGGAQNMMNSFTGGNNKPDDGDKTTSSSSNKTKTDSSDEKEKSAEADLALIYCSMVTKPVEAMVDILSGPDGVVWGLVSAQSKAGKKDDDSKTKGKWNVEMIKTMLQRTKSTIRSSKTDRNTANAKTLLSAINNTLKICKELEAEGKKAANLSQSWEKPKKDSTQVKEWKKSAKKAVASVRKLNSKKEVMTGNPMTAIMNPKENAEKESIQARSDLTKQMVDSHVAKMNSALDVYTKTQDTARQMQDTSIQMQNNLANLRKEIAELDITKATLETIRRVLSDCVTFLVDMKANIAKLVAFFQKVKVIIATANTSHIQMLLNNSKLTVGSLEQGGLLDHVTKRIIFEYSLDSICSFDFFQDIAGIYLQIDEKYILPGFTLVSRLGQSTDDSEVEQKKANLARYASDAQKGIIAIIEAKVKKIVADIQPRINLIGQTLKEAGLPQLPAEEVQAMQEGSREGSQNVQARIDNNNLGLKVLQQPPEVRDKAGTLVAHASNLEAQLQDAKVRTKKAADVATSNTVDNSDKDDEEDPFALDD